MTEYHCWTVIRYDSHDTNQTLQEDCVVNCEKYLTSHQYLTVDKFKIVRQNGQVTFFASGLHNHKANYILEIFNWLSKTASGSYGLLYFHDDEDVSSPKS